MTSVVSGTSDAVFVKDLEGRYVLINAAGAAFINKTVAELIGATDHELFDEATAQFLEQRDRAILASDQVQTYEEPLTTVHGESLVFLVTKGPVRNPQGEVTGLFGISRDITTQKQAETALRASEAALKEAQRLSHTGNWEWDLQTDTHRWSAEIYAIYGRDPALPPAAYPEVQQYFTEPSWSRLAEAESQGMANGQAYACDAEVVRPDGSHRWITAQGDATRDADGKVIKLQSTVQDITERKLSALQVNASEERLRLVVEATSDGFWDWDVTSGVVYRSPRYFEVTHTRPEDDSGDFEFFRRLIHPDDLPGALDCITAHRQGRSTQIEFDFRLAASANPQWLRVHGKAVACDATGSPTRIVGTLYDITEQKGLDDDLRTVLNEAHDAIWVTSAEGRFLFTNPAAHKLTGYSAQALEKLSLTDLFAPDFQETLPARLNALEGAHFDRREWQLLRASGELVPVELTNARLHDGRYMAFGRDLSEQKQAQLALSRREHQLARVIEGSAQGYWDWNLRTNTFEVSARWETMLGYAPGEMKIGPEHWANHVHPDDLVQANASIPAAAA